VHQDGKQRKEEAKPQQQQQQQLEAVRQGGMPSGPQGVPFPQVIN